ncbi:hypothetical protein CSC71_06160 [Pseudoxanthomonas sangjuensis]|nr:hypothetical protein CSC71_06160 [Pseudoxanthomonas sangjuensis]
MPAMGAPVAYALLFLALLATASAQVAFKHYHLSARRRSLVAAILLFACIPPVTFLAIRGLGVGKVYVFTSLSYALVAFLGWKMFRERITARQVQGLVVITLGCIVYTF